MDKCMCGSDTCYFHEPAGAVIARLARSQPTSPEPHRNTVNPNTNTINDWSPLDDGIEVVLPNGSDRVPSREEVEKSHPINDRKGGKRREYLPNPNMNERDIFDRRNSDRHPERDRDRNCHDSDDHRHHRSDRNHREDRDRDRGYDRDEREGS
ncbi:hypothetical protein MTR_4g094358 [Medicago truncatula]|uniref:Uncharacterized protein n=1 Tax=Medicago truncatula TaxID=3880 RepID=A0A072UNJ8_MEDTR|nr:hypothetical protein MTR_4g094358 [Medicago truncatula]